MLDEGDSAGLLQDSFENHFRDMFLNVTHIKYITCMHSFKAALIVFLVTSWLNWLRHCMHVVYFALCYEMIQAMCAPAPLCVQLSMRCEHSTVSALVWLAPAAEVKWSARLKCLPFDVLWLNKCTSCQEKKWQKQQLWVGWPTLAPPLR